jgi:hypothetical protein
MNLRFFFIFGLGLGLVACREPAEQGQLASSGVPAGEQALVLPADEQGGGFFDEGLLLEGAVDIRDAIPECIGASQAELELPDHPSILRGHVLAPSGRFASRFHFPDWLVGKAHASELDGELPVADVRVALYRHEKGEPVGPTLVETRTNFAGAWCMRMPEGFEAGPDLLLVATTAKSRDRLRRLFALPGDVDISPTSEGFVQVLVEDEIDPATVSVPVYLNMEVLANTAVDLLHPVAFVEDDDLREAIARVKKSLRRDERFAAIVARQSGR